MSRSALLLLLTAVMPACGAKSEDPHAAPAPDAGADDEAGSTGEGLPLPFIVDDHFHPSGCYSDAGCPVTIDTACEERAEGAQGQCYRFNYVAGLPFAGVFFQNVDASGAGNWGQAPGLLIVPGAREVSFYAAANAEGQVVKFKVGGIRDETLEHADTLDVEAVVTLGKTLQRYVLSLEGQSYTEVLSAFSWHVERTSGDGGDILLTLDDVRWE